MAARGVGGATDRDSLSTREANGATMLMEEDTAAVTKLLLVWLVIEVRELVGRLLVSDEVEQPQEFAVNAARGGHTRCLLYTSPSPRDQRGSRMPSSA